MIYGIQCKNIGIAFLDQTKALCHSAAIRQTSMDI